MSEHEWHGRTQVCVGEGQGPSSKLTHLTRLGRQGPLTGNRLNHPLPSQSPASHHRLLCQLRTKTPGSHPGASFRPSDQLLCGTLWLDHQGSAMFCVLLTSLFGASIFQCIALSPVEKSSSPSSSTRRRPATTATQTAVAHANTMHSGGITDRVMRVPCPFMFGELQRNQFLLISSEPGFCSYSVLIETVLTTFPGEAIFNLR